MMKSGNKFEAREIQGNLQKSLLPVAISEDPIVIEGAERPWIPDGLYDGRLIGHATSRFRTIPKVELRFLVTIRSPQGLEKIELGQFFSVAHVSEPIGAGRPFKPLGPRSKLAKLLSACQEVLGVEKSLSTKDLAALRWRLNVRTVMVDWDGNEIPQRSQYSVIRSVSPIDPEEAEDW